MPAARSAVVRSAVTAAVVLLGAGCGSGGDTVANAANAGNKADVSTSPSASKSHPAAGTETVETIAEAIGCKAIVQSDNKELRQGSCREGKVPYTVITFESSGGMTAWLQEAMPYGGTYLVGERWVISATAKALDPVQAKIGGTVESGADHTQHAS